VEITFKNETPWNTEDLVPILSRFEFTYPLVKIKTIRPRPGVPADNQAVAAVRLRNNSWKKNPTPSWVEVQIISPKRVAKRAEVLDRLAGVQELSSSEVALPPKIIARLYHCLVQVDWACRNGYCEHELFPPNPAPLIRGDLKARAHPEPSLSDLQKKLGGVLRSIDHQEHLLKKHRKKEATLRKRIAKLVEKKLVEKKHSMSSRRKSI
jgi:hypothetical protein